MKLNIQPQSISFGSVKDLLNGAFASLSGPVGFVPTQPRIVVKRIQVVNPSSPSVEFELFKGASGGSAAGTQILYASVAAKATFDVETDFVLEAADFLTGTCGSSGSLDVNISAEIEF